MVEKPIRGPHKAHRVSGKDYQRLFNQVGCGVFISSRDGRYLDVNPALVSMLGYDNKAQLLSVDIPEQLYQNPHDREIYQQNIKETGQVVDYELNLRKRDGSPVKVLLTCTPRFNTKKEIIGYEGIVVNLDRRLEMERTLRLSQIRLMQSEKMAAMGRLTSQLAHELNNPLFGILNTMELLKTEVPQGNRRRKLLDMSIEELLRMAEMLKKMLAFSTESRTNDDRLDLKPLVKDILFLCEKQLCEKNIKTIFRCTADSVIFNGSKSQIHQVISNMIENAQDAMPSGGELALSIEPDKDDISIVIEDNGAGIPPENIPLIFDSFFTTKKTKAQGLGLGLWVCYNIIHDHNGRIDVESEFGKGTRFNIGYPKSVES